MTLPPYTEDPRDDAPAGTPLVQLAEEAEESAPVGSSGIRKLPGHRSRVVLLTHPDADPEDAGSVVELVVRVDNRDYLRWDKTAPRQKWPKAGDAPFLVASFTSWSAANRAGLFSEPFAVFERLCLEVGEVRDGEEDDDARPTR